MIESIKLKFGSQAGTEPTSIKLDPVTVIVGPNNSGKSTLLREIQQACRAAEGRTRILDSICVQGFPDQTAVTDELAKLRRPAQVGEAHLPGSEIYGHRSFREQHEIGYLIDVWTQPNDNLAAFCRTYLHMFTSTINGDNRTRLIKEQAIGDLTQPPQSTLQTLVGDNPLRHQFRRIVHEAIQKYFVIDPTNGHLRIRLSSREPRSELEEIGIHTEARAFHAAATLIDELSDGVKAFIGILLEALAGHPRVLLIDEPEAFLHPSLSAKLGVELCLAAKAAGKRVLATTHSDSFLRGCVLSGVPLSVLRLTYRDGVATARVLPSDDLRHLMRHPLLRSSGVFNALFYEYVVVTEADSDRAFYQEVNERLLRHKPEWGIPNCLFLNAQNKQTIARIVEPLRRLGIPVAAIVDIDVIKEGGRNWTRHLSALGIPALSQTSFESHRLAIFSAAKATNVEMKTGGGIDILQAEDRLAAEQLLNSLGEFGMFVVRRGELEQWLPSLSGSRSKPDWLVDIFEKMGEDPETPGYVMPGNDDVWEFISSVRRWLVDPCRKGIPTQQSN